MNGMPEESAVGEMVAGFIRDAGGGEEFALLCRKLLHAQESGSVCLRVTEEERAVLEDSPLVSLLPDDGKLFVLDGERSLFYTRRNWKYESFVRERISRTCALLPDAVPELPDEEAFYRLKEEQRRAVGIMASRRFSILTGGPGTGKTYTISRAVRLMRHLGAASRIAIAAPTGKAAARVRETMTEEGLTAATIHALLQPRHDGVTFQHDAAHLLELDWLIVDEASMIDLPLMAKMLAALPENCRLTLVGDPCQLASVEAGRVFGDLCAMEAVQPCIAELKESTRFKDAPEIFRLAAAIRAGEGEQALEVLKDPAAKQLVYAPRGVAAAFEKFVWPCWEPLRQAKTPAEALEALKKCRILCALRRGKFGVEKFNAFLRNHFREECPVPMMVTHNDAALGVSNGDVGVMMPGDGRNVYFFRDGEAAKLPVAALPGLETAFASTIHKSQGSEYACVVIVLPQHLDEEGAAFLSRELFYTAVTRAKEKVILIADDEAVRRSCSRKTERCTGL